MKAFISGVVAAVLLALLGAAVLNTEVQRGAEAAYSSESARL
jgi:hypothetical protein